MSNDFLQSPVDKFSTLSGRIHEINLTSSYGKTQKPALKVIKKRLTSYHRCAIIIFNMNERRHADMFGMTASAVIIIGLLSIIGVVRDNACLRCTPKAV